MSVEGKRNRIITPSTKHCHAGVGHLCDHVFGERSGEEGAGEDEETPESAAMEVARWGRRPYLGDRIHRIFAQLDDLCMTQSQML